MDFPPDFRTRTRQWLDDYPLLEKALEEEAPVSIRLHPAKQTAPLPLPYEPVKWCATGYYLPERPAFTFDPLLHAGVYYVQEAASMFPEQAVRQYLTSAVTCLDICAAPGGKSTHLLSLLPERSLLVSNEVIRSRCAVLAENVLKWGSPYVFVTNNTPEDIGRLTHLFDVMIADLPCSGEGMFRKDAGSRKAWSVAGVQYCATRQRRIIHDVWPALKPGGLLVYSTCTFNREENEENIRSLVENLHAEVLPLSVGDDWRISGAWDNSYPAYRFFPHKTKGEGFFLAVLRKPEGERKVLAGRAKNKLPANLPDSRMKAWLSAPENYRLDTTGTLIQAIPNEYAEMYQLLSGQLRMVTAGIPVADRKGKDLLPMPALALSTAFRRDAFPSVALSWEEAVGYLQRETLVLPEDTPKGFVTVTYRKRPLGFVKNIGNRANNLYPQEWRIRSRYLPDKAPDVVF